MTIETDRRRALLTALMVAPAYQMPARSLREQIGLAGYAVSLDRVLTDCAWLTEQGLVERLSQEPPIFLLTDRGADVVLGNAQVPGVKRPEPGELA